MYMLHTSQVVGISSERTSLDSLSSTDVNTTVMSWCILPNKTCILESLGENVGLHSVIIPKRFLKIRLSFLTHTHCVTFPTHNCPNIWQNSDNFISYNFLFTIDSIFLSRNILMETIRKEIAQLFISQIVTLQHTFQPSLHMSQKDKYKKNNNINFNDNFHFTSHS
jgi:hypothetical protein